MSDFETRDGCAYYGDVRLGEIYREVDGYFVFVPARNFGAWGSYGLRGVADLLDEVNAPWDKEVSDYFDNLVEEGEQVTLEVKLNRNRQG